MPIKSTFDELTLNRQARVDKMLRYGADNEIKEVEFAIEEATGQEVRGMFFVPDDFVTMVLHQGAVDF
ncbi:MAG TPA: hypothetical protein VF597_04260 [Candidatus Saccharimonadales bacterium]|jgi:hypothetical protein